MNILDENIPESQRQLLRSWRIRTQQIGHELGRRGMKKLFLSYTSFADPPFSLVI